MILLPPPPAPFVSIGYLHKDITSFTPCLFVFKSFSSEAIGKIPTEQNCDDQALSLDY